MLHLIELNDKTKILEKAASLQLKKKMISARISSQDLDHIIIPRQLSVESQMICSYHPIMVVSLY